MERCEQASIILQQVKDILNRRFQTNSQIHISFLGVLYYDIPSRLFSTTVDITNVGELYYAISITH